MSQNLAHFSPDVTEQHRSLEVFQPALLFEWGESSFAYMDLNGTVTWTAWVMLRDEGSVNEWYKWHYCSGPVQWGVLGFCPMKTEIGSNTPLYDSC